MNLNFLELVASRHSCRHFDGEPIKKLDLLYIKQAILKAPSAGNLQAYQVFVVSNQPYKEKLCRAALADHGQLFLWEVPTFLVFFAMPFVSERKYSKRGSGLYSIQDATIACTYAQLAATDAGVASVWIGAFIDKDVCDALGLFPDTHTPVAILALGYSANENLTSPAKCNRVNTSYE
jgi:nitroreductase